MNKILIVGPEYRNHRGGIGAVIAEQKRMFPEAAFYCSYKPLSKVASVIFGASRLLLFPLYIFSHPKIKIVHIHGASRGSFHRKFRYFLISKLAKKKVIYHIHGAEFHLFMQEASLQTQKRIRRIISDSNCVIVLSDGWLDFFRKHYPDAQLQRIYNPAGELHHLERKERLSPKVQFLFLGYISERKGCYDLINAADELRKQYPNFHVTIGGNGETQKIIELIREKKLEDTVSFVGWVSGPEKEQLLYNSDVYLLPSKNEGLPVSILEAMANGMPVISTPVGGIPEMIEDGLSGFLIEAGNIAALVEKMKFFIERKEMIESMGKRSQELIHEKFSSEVIQRELQKLYDELLKMYDQHGN